MKRSPALFLSLLMLTMTSQAQNSPHSPDPQSAEYKAIVGAAATAATGELKQAVTLDTDVLNVSADWAFLIAQLVDANGVPFAYRGTPLEAAAAAGGVSRVYAGLLRAHDGHWRVVQQAIGPTDVTWEAWQTQFGAPAALFATD